MPCSERDLTAQQMHTGALDVVQGASLSGDEQRGRVAQRPRFVLGLSRPKGPLRTAQRVGCQVRGALLEGSGRGQTAPRLGPAGSALQLGGDALVRAGRGLGQVPRTPVAINPRVGRFSQCAMH